MTDEMRAAARAKRDPGKDRARARAREWRVNNPERAKEQAVRTYAGNRPEMIAAASAWNLANPERRKEISRASAARIRAANPERLREAKRRRREIPAVRLNDSVSSYIRICLRGRKSGAGWETLVGYTLSDLMARLTSGFLDGMTWDNYGEWQIDHIRPVASFHFSSTTDQAFLDCWALSNLQPLWAADNAKKNSWWNGVRALRHSHPNPLTEA